MEPEQELVRLQEFIKNENVLVLGSRVSVQVLSIEKDSRYLFSFQLSLIGRDLKLHQLRAGWSHSILLRNTMLIERDSNT